jgi:hypothetical protein
MGKIVGKENIAAKVAIIHKKVLVKFGYKWDMKVLKYFMHPFIYMATRTSNCLFLQAN